MSAPEYQPQQPVPEGVQQVPEQVEIPREVEQATGVKPTPQQPSVNIASQNSAGKQLAQQQPQPSAPSMSVPAQSQQQLDDYAKGSAEDSQTWFGVFWLRRVKKALQEGFQIVFGGKN